VTENQVLVIAAARMLANDVDDDRMILAETFDAVGGTVSLSSSGQVMFVPHRDHTGLASFRHAADTPDGGRAEAAVSIFVAPVNDAPDAPYAPYARDAPDAPDARDAPDAPVARDDTGITMAEGGNAVVPIAALLANDRDIDGDFISLVDAVGDENLLVERGAGVDLRITPAAFFFGTAFVTYTINDPSGLTATATAAVTVTPVNSAPEPAAARFVTNEDVPLTLTASQLLANDVERDGGDLTVVSLSGFGGGRAELFANGTIFFDPMLIVTGRRGSHTPSRTGRAASSRRMRSCRSIRSTTSPMPAMRRIRSPMSISSTAFRTGRWSSTRPICSWRSPTSGMCRSSRAASSWSRRRSASPGPCR